MLLTMIEQLFSSCTIAYYKKFWSPKLGGKSQMNEDEKTREIGVKKE